MVLIEDVTLQVRPEVGLDLRRQRGGPPEAVGQLVSRPAIAGIVRADDQILHEEVLEAVQPCSFRQVVEFELDGFVDVEFFLLGARPLSLFCFLFVLPGGFSLGIIERTCLWRCSFGRLWQSLEPPDFFVEFFDFLLLLLDPAQQLFDQGSPFLG